MVLNSGRFALRLKELREKHTGGNRAAFARMLGISEGALRKYEHGISVPSLSILQKIQEKTGVDINYLVSGQESVVRDSPAPYHTDIITVPLVAQYAHAGYLSGYQDEDYMEDLPKVAFPAAGPAKGNYMAFEIRGDSMYDGSPDSYDEGEIALCREIQKQHWVNKLHLHKWRDYIIVNQEEGILLKRIIDHQVEQGMVTCHSLNPMYEDFQIELNSVMQLFNVIKTVRNR